MGNLVEGTDFHRFYFENGNYYEEIKYELLLINLYY